MIYVATLGSRKLHHLDYDGYRVRRVKFAARGDTINQVILDASIVAYEQHLDLLAINTRDTGRRVWHWEQRRQIDVELPRGLQRIA